MMPRLEVRRAALAAPWMTRAAAKTAVLGARAARRTAAAKSQAPAVRTLRRPWLSARLPEVRRGTARPREMALMIQVWPVSPAWRWAAVCGARMRGVE